MLLRCVLNSRALAFEAKACEFKPQPCLQFPQLEMGSKVLVLHSEGTGNGKRNWPPQLLQYADA